MFKNILSGITTLSFQNVKFSELFSNGVRNGQIYIFIHTVSWKLKIVLYYFDILKIDNIKDEE